MTSLKTSIKTITYLSDTGCLEIQGASLVGYSRIDNTLPINQGRNSIINFGRSLRLPHRQFHHTDSCPEILSYF
ncbi:hypothetical protein AW115_28565 [Escherichia coli]|nr:hypothetical protein AW066_28360 [Escherichia coli]OTE41623.1 hypothetical protein AW115_28565 [Escherichia coli]